VFSIQISIMTACKCYNCFFCLLYCIIPQNL